MGALTDSLGLEPCEFVVSHLRRIELLSSSHGIEHDTPTSSDVPLRNRSGLTLTLHRDRETTSLEILNAIIWQCLISLKIL